MPRKQINPAPAPADDPPLLKEVNRRFDSLTRLLLAGQPYDWAELDAVRKRRLELLQSVQGSEPRRTGAA
jgi:hypothetical protein